MRDERYWKYGNIAYGGAILAAPIAAFEIGYRYFGSLLLGNIFAIPCIPLLYFFGKLGTLSELAADYGWENPARTKDYLTKSVIVLGIPLIAVLLSTFATLGVWQLAIVLFLAGTILHNYACHISNAY